MKLIPLKRRNGDGPTIKPDPWKANSHIHRMQIRKSPKTRREPSDIEISCAAIENRGFRQKKKRSGPSVATQVFVCHSYKFYRLSPRILCPRCRIVLPLMSVSFTHSAWIESENSNSNEFCCGDAHLALWWDRLRLSSPSWRNNFVFSVSLSQFY